MSIYAKINIHYCRHPYYLFLMDRDIGDLMNTIENAHSEPYRDYINRIVQTYFSNQENEILLRKNEVLLHEGQQNDKLFYVKKGKLKGYWLDEKHQKIESFESVHGSFIGIPSFFSDLHISLHTVTAIDDSVLHYITLSQPVEQWNNTQSLEEQFMPLVINELIHRQLHVQQLAKEKAQTQQLLAQHEKMAALGTVSAGIAHELNNAIAVIQHSNDWLSQTIKHILIQENPLNLDAFETGLKLGRTLSNKEIKAAAQVLMKQHKITQQMAEWLVPLQVESSQIKQYAAIPELPKTMHHFWELGATMKDMQTASEMAAHVVRSVKALGARSTKMQTGVDVNETIEKAVALLGSSLRLVEFHKELQPLQTITCAASELIQVWVNLIQNALDSMFDSTISHPKLSVSTAMEGQSIQVKITDNGNGIPQEIIHKIFDPQFTTKSGESTVGLGLGLTIVNKIITAHQGTVQVQSEPGNTMFTVTLPVGGQYE